MSSSVRALNYQHISCHRIKQIYPMSVPINDSNNYNVHAVLIKFNALTVLVNFACGRDSLQTSSFMTFLTSRLLFFLCSYRHKSYDTYRYRNAWSVFYFYRSWTGPHLYALEFIIYLPRYYSDVSLGGGNTIESFVHKFIFQICFAFPLPDCLSLSLDICIYRLTSLSLSFSVSLSFPPFPSPPFRSLFCIYLSCSLYVYLPLLFIVFLCTKWRKYSGSSIMYISLVVHVYSTD